MSAGSANTPGGIVSQRIQAERLKKRCPASVEVDPPEGRLVLCARWNSISSIGYHEESALSRLADPDRKWFFRSSPLIHRWESREKRRGRERVDNHRGESR